MKRKATQTLNCNASASSSQPTRCSTTLSLSGVFFFSLSLFRIRLVGHLFSRSPSFLSIVLFFFVCVFWIFCCPFLSEVNVRYFTLSLWFLAEDHFRALACMQCMHACLYVFCCVRSFFVWLMQLSTYRHTFYVDAHSTHTGQTTGSIHTIVVSIR